MPLPRRPGLRRWPPRCASSGAVPRPFPAPGAPSHRAPAPAPDRAAPVAGRAGERSWTRRWLCAGRPTATAAAIRRGFDCSGFVWYVFGSTASRVPRTVVRAVPGGPRRRAAGSAAGRSRVLRHDRRQPRRTSGSSIGGDEFVHAPSSRGEVRVEHLARATGPARFVGARRLSAVSRAQTAQVSTPRKRRHAARCWPLRVSRRVLLSVNWRMCRSSSV